MLNHSADDLLNALGDPTRRRIVDRLSAGPRSVSDIAAPLGNYFVSILKATPYLAVLAVPEMLGRAFDIASETYRYTEPLVVAGLIFLVLALAISHGVKRLERRLLAVGTR